MIDIHDYSARLERFKSNISKLRHGRLALKFLDHLVALGLSQGRIVKYAEHLPPLLRIIDFNPKEAKREDVEKVVAWINSQPYKEWTKHGYKLVLRKFIQYAKVGDCSRNAPMPEEVSWISLRVKEKDSRVTPDSLLSKEEFEAIVKAAENPRDRALVYVLFEAALRPGELLTMNVGSVEKREAGLKQPSDSLVGKKVEVRLMDGGRLQGTLKEASSHEIVLEGKKGDVVVYMRSWRSFIQGCFHLRRAVDTQHRTEEAEGTPKKLTND